MIKNFKILVFFSFILMYAINKMEKDIESSEFIVLCIGEILLLYGGICIVRNSKQKSIKEIQEDLKKFYNRSEDRKKAYKQIYSKKNTFHI